MADYEAISKVIRNAIRKEVDKQIDAAYRRGYADGKARIEPTKTEKEQIYNHGLDAAWECARKIVSCEIPWEVFGLRVGQSSDEAIFRYSASEAITKIKEYEEKEIEKSCDNCGHYVFGCAYNCDDSLSEWTPKQAEIQCNATDKGENRMTREKRKIAAEEFKEWRDSYYNKNKLPATMFIEEVIKILEQEPCEDAISRQATIEAFQMFRGYESNRTNAEWVDRIETVVEKLPPVNPTETVTEFADRCRECGAKYGKLLKEEQCNDAISRQDAIRICEERGHDNSAYCIRQLPPVNPQPKTGHWISYNWQESLLGITLWGIKCDQCNKQYKYGGEMGGTYSYCPNCGVRMVEPQERSDNK